VLHRPALLLAAVLVAPFAAPLLAQGSATASPIVFNGVLVQDGKIRVSLHNPNTGETKWVQVGKSYGNYTVGYEPALPATKQTPATKDTVLLTLGDKVQRIPLQDAPVVTPAAASQAAQTDAAQTPSLADALARARSAPNSDPRAIAMLEHLLSDGPLAVSETVGISPRVTFSTDESRGQLVISRFSGTADVLIDNATGAVIDFASDGGMGNPDGTTTTTLTDDSGRVLAVVIQPADAFFGANSKTNPDGTTTTTYYNASGQAVGVRTSPAPTK
jgi:hypothetical protein